MKVAFHTLGCKVNRYETEAIKEAFENKGYETVGENDFADVYIINTCTVTAVATRKSGQFIRRARKKNAGALVAVTGCFAQTEPDRVAAIEGVDIVTGSGDKSKLIEYVEERLGKSCSAPEVHVKKYKELRGYEESGAIKSMESRTRAYIKIQEGCDRFCSYCIIPYARGESRSRAEEDILNEARALVGAGFKELVLTGINTALYADLPGLLQKLDDMSGGFRVRLSSLEPTVVDKEFVAGLFGYERLCHHLHLSLQSGSNKILKQMNRNYTREDYLQIVETLQRFDPLYGITTDIIAGFPGETEEDFAKSLEIIEDVKFCKVHGFNYSVRPGTGAAEMQEQIPPYVKKERVRRLIEKGEQEAYWFFRKNIGFMNKVLFEDYDEKTGKISGYTDNYIRAYADSEGGNIPTDFVNVTIADMYEDGVLVKY